ncbi:MAG: sensor histidine kinase [Prolixibacteraceae bacterium]|nr:sensor histidine kinase [Prolixibacteraceae bacterium]MBN2649644.1 sensor histidine kinase [Prolixibacteraceae bacterium]
MFYVKNTVRGIPENEVEDVFIRFCRATNVNKVPTFGAGLGLSIVKELIEWPGGYIWIESEKGKGTTFILL